MRIVRTNNGVCKLSLLSCELVISSRCGLFDCKFFRQSLCRKKLLTAYARSVKNLAVSESWMDSEEYIFRMTQCGSDADKKLMALLKDLEYIWSDSDTPSQCRFEKELQKIRSKCQEEAKG